MTYRGRLRPASAVEETHVGGCCVDGFSTSRVDARAGGSGAAKKMSQVAWIAIGRLLEEDLWRYCPPLHTTKSSKSASH
jgi:hypothetical protein